MIEIKDINISNYRKNPLWLYDYDLRKSNQYSGIIYMYKNNANNKVYIGQTCRPYQRHKQHIMVANNIYSKDFSTPIHHAIKKYGINGFSYYVLQEVIEKSYESLKQKLNKLEQEYICKFNSTNRQYGYNIQNGGTEIQFVKSKRNTSVDKYSLNGEYICTFDSMASAARNVSGTPNVIKTSCINGTKSYGFRWGLHNEELKIADKRIYQYDLTGNYIRSFESMQKAADVLNVHISGISKALIDKYRTFAGFYWRKEKVDLLPFSDFPKAICQYDLEGNFIHWYHNINEAVQAINASGSSAICAAINRNNAYKGFLWRKELSKKINPAHNRHINKAGVVAIYPDSKIYKYQTIRDASEKTGVNIGAVNRSIRHKNTKSTNGIIFLREQEYNEKYGIRTCSTT